jgi:hypothetical protein
MEIKMKYVIIAAIGAGFVILYIMSYKQSNFAKTILTTYQKTMELENKVNKLERSIFLVEGRISGSKTEDSTFSITYESDMRVHADRNDCGSVTCSELNCADIHEINTKCGPASQTPDIDFAMAGIISKSVDAESPNKDFFSENNLKLVSEIVQEVPLPDETSIDEISVMNSEMNYPIKNNNKRIYGGNITARGRGRGGRK